MSLFRSNHMHSRRLAVAAAATALSVIAGAQTPPQSKTVNLQQTFHTRSQWQLSVTEGDPTKDYGDNDAPGALTLCLRKGTSGSCDSSAVTPPPREESKGSGNAWEPHYLYAAKPVYPHSPQAAPLLYVFTGSLHAGNGDQIVATQLLAYDQGTDTFRRVFAKSTGRNNNQEIRFITDGPLRGSVISAEPQQRSPYGFWIAIYQPAADGEYKQVQRFASATRYNDGNQLAVIDSEMPGIFQHMGLWKPGDALPVPKTGKACAKPNLKNGELWCK